MQTQRPSDLETLWNIVRQSVFNGHSVAGATLRCHWSWSSSNEILVVYHCQRPCAQLQKIFFFTPQIVGINILREKPMNYVKFQMATNCINPQLLKVISMISPWYINDLHWFTWYLAGLALHCNTFHCSTPHYITPHYSTVSLNMPHY